MLILMLLTTVFPTMVMLFVMLCAGIVAVAQNGYPDESMKPAPGRRLPRLSLRSIVAILSSDD